MVIQIIKHKQVERTISRFGDKQIYVELFFKYIVATVLYSTLTPWRSVIRLLLVNAVRFQLCFIAVNYTFLNKNI